MNPAHAYALFDGGLHDAIRLVETALTKCRVLLEGGRAPQRHNYDTAARAVEQASGRLEAVWPESETSNALLTLDDLPRPGSYEPFAWRGVPYSPAFLAVPAVIDDLLMDVGPLRSWLEQEVEEEDKLADCRALLEHWPADLALSLRTLRGQLEHECVLAMALEPEPESEPPAKAEGPFPPDGFRWRGREYRGLPPLPWRLLDHLWGQPERCAPFRDLPEPVWQDHAVEVDGVTFGSARKKANAWLDKQGIPFRVGSKSNVAKLEEI